TSTYAATTYDFEHVGSGTNNLNLGAGSIAGIVSGITFIPGGSTSALNINDQASIVSRTFTFDGFFLNVPGQLAVYLANGLKSFTFNGGNAIDSMSVTGTNGTGDVVTLNMGGGDDQALIIASAASGSAT